MSAPLTPEQERAKAVLDTFWWGKGWRAGPTQIDAVADAIRDAVAEQTTHLRARLAALEAAREADELDHKNEGSEVAADCLAKIARAGDHRGVFGGERMEKAARAIMALHARLAALVVAGDRLDTVVDGYMYRKPSRICPEAARAAWQQAKDAAGEGKG